MTNGAPGRSTRRLGDRALVTGEGRYVADLATDKTLHAHFVRSTVAHGLLNGVETETARALEGVAAVLIDQDLDLGDLPPPHGISRDDVARPPLARRKVRYVGEPIAVVIADDAAIAADTADLVWPEIEDLPASLDPSIDGPALFEGPNRLVHELTEPRSTVAGDLPISATVEVHNQRIAAVAIEGLTVLAEPLANGRLRVTVGHQAPHRLKGQLAGMLRMDPEEIQVVVPDVGGGFGLKGAVFTEYAVVAAAARLLGRPIMWLESRREHLVAGMHARDQLHSVSLHGDSTGRIRKAHIAITADVGAYPQGGAIIPTLSRFVASGLYDIEDVTVEMSTVVTNRAPTTSYRGAGRPEAAYAIERAIDEFASAAGLDPATVRRRNFIRSDQLPYRTATGALYDSGDYARALDLALELVDEPAVRAEQARRRESGGNPIGIGIGTFIERTGGAAGSGEFGEVEIDRDGKIVVRTGSTDAGQGHATVWSQTVAGVFDMDPEEITVIAGDTDQVADGVGTYASRSAQLGASAAFRMGQVVRERAKEVAGSFLEASAADIEAVSGGFRVVGVPGSEVDMAEIATHAAEVGVELKSSELFAPDSQAFPYGAHVAVVEVDRDTGVVTVERLVAVDDCGNVLNPMIVAGQMHGSLVQGLGQALYERVVYSEAGTPMTASMMDYLIPTAASVPPMILGRTTTPAPNNPLGVKGTGEAGCIGAPPAIVNATLDALRPYGVTDLEMPLTPERVWSALHAQSSKS